MFIDKILIEFLFQKQWSWDPYVTPLVYREWEKKVKARYKDIILLIRKPIREKDDYKPTWVEKSI